MASTKIPLKYHRNLIANFNLTLTDIPTKLHQVVFTSFFSSFCAHSIGGGAGEGAEGTHPNQEVGAPYTLGPQL